MTRRLWQHVTSKRVQTGLFVIVLGVGLPLVTATSAQANWLGSVRSWLGLGSSLGSAAGNTDGGGDRNICATPPTAAEPVDLQRLTLDDLFADAASPTAVDHTVDSYGAYSSLIALVPPADFDSSGREKLVAGKTLSPYPSFGLYVPLTSVDNSIILELSIADNTTGQYLLERWSVALPSVPGWTHIQLPSSQPGLEPDTLYYWTIALRCVNGDSRRTFQEVSGLIVLEPAAEKTPLLTDDYADYQQRGLWYDMVEQLMINRDENPQEWNGFLRDYFQVVDKATSGDLILQLIP